METENPNLTFDLVQRRLPEARSDARESFELAGLDRGDVLLILSAPALATRAVLARSAPEGADVNSVTLGAGTTLTGRLVRPDGSVVSGALVRLRPGGFGALPAERETRSDDDGRFRFGSVAPSRVALLARVGGQT